MTDTDGFRETPNPSSVAYGMGGPNPPSVIRNGWYRWAKFQSVHCVGSNRDRTTDTDNGWGVAHLFVPEKESVRHPGVFGEQDEEGDDSRMDKAGGVSARHFSWVCNMKR